MTPSDVYRSRLRKGITPPDEFYKSPNTGIDYSLLNGITPPSMGEIGAAQMASIRQTMPISPSLQKFADKLNKDMMVKLNDEGEMVEIEEAIHKIEQALSYRENGGAANLLNNKKATSSVEALVSSFRILEQRLSEVYKMISASGGAIPGSQLEKELSRVDDIYRSVVSQLAAFDNGATMMSPETVGYLKTAEWLSRRIKGKYLEVVGTEWINKKVPENIKVVNVGKVMGPTVDILGKMSGGAKMIRTDIMAFDMTKELTISFTTGSEKTPHTMSLQDFVSFIEKQGETTTITLDADNLQALQSALVFGVQAKAGQGQAVFNPKPVSINQVIQLEGNSNYANALSLLVSLAKEDEYLAKTGDTYQALFNYCLSKGINNIIGKENSLVLTRQGITTMREYLLSQWEYAQKIVQAKKRVNILSPDAGVDVYYSGANFLTSG